MRFAVALTLWSVGCLSATAQDTKVTPLVAKPLEGLPNKEGLLVRVEMAPGSAGSVHRHNAHVFVYVLEGSIVMQVKGGKEVTLGPGQTFTESPNDIHVVGRNASETKPAVFLAFFVKEQGAPVVVPVP